MRNTSLRFPAIFGKVFSRFRPWWRAPCPRPSAASAMACPPIAFKNHLGVYPPIKKDRALIRETARHRNEKGNLSFKYSEPIPYELIGRVAVALASEYAQK
jgi:hypothetical protein